MPSDERERSRFWAFWSSLPGVLTGFAAVLGAAATLAALLIGGNNDEKSPSPLEAGPAPSTVPGAAGQDCFSQYFKGIAGYRLGTVEAGAYEDVLVASEPKAGPLGMTLTDVGRPIAAIRFAFFPKNTFFKIESVVDGRCRPVAEYENRETGDRQNWPDSSAVRIRLGDRYYDVTANGAGSIVRISFESVAP